MQLLGHAIQPCNSGQLVGGSYIFYVHHCLGKGSNVTIIFFRWVEIDKLSNDFMKETLLTFTIQCLRRTQCIMHKKSF